MAEVKDKTVKLSNTGTTVIVDKQVRIMPGQSITLPESKISEGLKRMIGAGLTKSE